MKLDTYCEIIGTLESYKIVNIKLKLVFQIHTDIEILLDAIPKKELDDCINRRIGIFNNDSDYKIAIEKATRDALRHERDDVFMFLRAYKQFTKELREYLILPKKHGGLKTPFVLIPSQVNNLFNGTFGSTIYENVLAQTIVFTLINFGMRPPSEIINLNLENVNINNNGAGYIWIKEDKKDGVERQYFHYDKKVLSSRVYRTPKNYINNWRNQVKNKHSDNALFLQPNGRRITGKWLRTHIVNRGKQIIQDNRFKLYTCRHTFATYYYDWTKDLKRSCATFGA